MAPDQHRAASLLRGIRMKAPARLRARIAAQREASAREDADSASKPPPSTTVTKKPR